MAESVVAGPGFPRLALGLAWLGSTITAAVLGGWVLVGLGALATAAVTSNKLRALTLGLSLAASAVYVAAGLVSIAGASLLLVAGGLITGALSLRARTMAMS